MSASSDESTRSTASAPISLHQKKYEEMIKKGDRLEIRSVRFINHGIPRSGKTTFWRRLIDPNHKMKEDEPSTGVANEQKPVVIKDVKIETNMVASGDWFELDEGGYANMLLQIFDEVISNNRQSSNTGSADILSSTRASDVTTPPASTDILSSDVSAPSPASANTPSSDESTPSTAPADVLSSDASAPSTDVLSSDASAPSLASANTPPSDESTRSTASASSPTAAPSSGDKISASLRFLEDKASETQWKQLKLKLEDTILLSCADTGGHAEFLDMHAALVNGPSFHLIFSRLDEDFDKCFPVYFTDAMGHSSSIEDSDLTMKEVIFQILASVKCLGNSHSSGTNSPEVEETMKKLKSEVMFVGTYADSVTNDKHVKKLKPVLDKLKVTFEYEDVKLKQMLKEAAEDVGSTFEDEDVDKLKGSFEYKDLKLQQMLREELGGICDPVMYAVNDRSDMQLMLKVDNKKGSKSEILEIRSILKKKIEDNFERIPIPASWFVLALLIRDCKDPMMTFNVCAEEAKKVDVEKEELKSVLWFLQHGLGMILYYNDKVFKVEAVYKSVTKLIEKFYIVGRKRKDKSVELFKKFGIFSLEAAKEEISPKGLIPPIELVPLLEHLNIITQAPDLEVSSEIKDPYFMPCALRCCRDTTLYEAADGNPEPLKIIFKSHFTPIGIFPALIKVLYSEKKWKIPIKKPTLFKNKVKFLVVKQTIYIMSYLHYFEIAIEADCPGKTNFEKLSSSIRRDFEEALNKVVENTRFHFLKDYQYAFLCTSEKCMCSHPHLAVFKLNDIASTGGSMECYRDDSIYVQFIDRQRLWFPKGKSQLVDLVH